MSSNLVGSAISSRSLTIVSGIGRCSLQQTAVIAGSATTRQLTPRAQSAVDVGWIAAPKPARIDDRVGFPQADPLTFSGLTRLAEGGRRTVLEQAFEALLRDDLSGRVAPVDAAACRPFDVRIMLIVGIAPARSGCSAEAPALYGFECA